MTKVALITGASGGIGREVSAGLASDGYELSLVARSINRLEAFALELTNAHKTTPLISAADLTIPQEAERVVEEVIERYG